MPLDGNYALHIQNGGCPATHPTRNVFCQGRAGHYNYLHSPHYAPVISLRNGTETITWTGA